MICNRYCCLLKMTRSSYTRTSIWHAKNTNEDEDTVSCFSPVVIVVFSFRGETNGNCGVLHTLFTLEMDWDPLHICSRQRRVFGADWTHIRPRSEIRWFWPQGSTCERRSRILAVPEDAQDYLINQSITQNRDSQIVRGIYVVCHLGLLFMSTSQELHDHNVGFGHLQYAIHLLTTKNINKWLPIIPVAINIFTQRERTFEVKDIL